MARPRKGKVTCICGRTFKTDNAIRQHHRDSPLHLNRAKGSSEKFRTTSSPSLLERPLKDIDLDSATDAGPAHEAEALKEPLEGEAQKRERKYTDADQKSRDFEGTQKGIKKEAAGKKADGRTKQQGTSDVVEPAGRLYAIRAIAGKGKGVITTTRIAKGTRILSEAPIFRVPRDNVDFEALERMVATEVNCLNQDQQRAFFDLTNIYGDTHSQALGIARTNVLPLGSNVRSGGLFLEASRINHSCRHNAQNTWNENIARLTIHALRDIEEGEEITISYLASTPRYAERQQFLKEKFKFDCKCELCSLPPAQRNRSDARLTRLQAIDSAVGTFFWGALEPKEALHLLHTMFSLFDQEGIWDASIARAYNDAYEIAIKSGDESRARVFAERTYDARRLIEGDDSPVTMKKKRAAEELSAQVSQGIGEAQFENWLWMLNTVSES